jgi:hypothetical protein
LLKQRAFVRSSEIVMHCGVAICGECYEVGSEVVEALNGARGDRSSERRSPDPSGPAHVDLRDILARQAQDLGIGEVTLSPGCSAHDRSRFFSHRASGGRDGRMVAYLGTPAGAA